MNPSKTSFVGGFLHRPCRTLAALALLPLFPFDLMAQVLPPPLPSANERNLSQMPRLFVHGYRFEGNTVFSSSELAKATEPYTNRELHSEELELARRAVTMLYINKGYINSGALIPDQEPADGIIVMRVTEGVLSSTDLHGNRWIRDSYINRYVRRWAGTPLDMNELQDGLQLLRQNPNIERINAELKPGASLGESVLDMRIEDRQPFRVGLQFDNQRPPSIGEEELWVLASDLNLTGNSDPLDIRYGLLNGTDDSYELSGVDNLDGAYRFPIAELGTTIELFGGRHDTRLIEETFAPLNVKSLTTSYGTVLRQPVYQTANDEAALSVGFDYRKNESWLLDERFSLSPGADRGEMAASVLRLSQDWITRGQSHVLALRSTFNLGLNIFDAADNGIDRDPNGSFFSWVGQGQYAQRLLNTQNEFIFRLSGQWTSEPLLALEQLSIGGFETVRGYLENQMVRDRGLLSSVELRLPLFYDKTGAGIVYIAPFFDFGAGWNVEDNRSLNTIASVGAGLLLSPNKHFNAQLYWGYRLMDVDLPDHTGAQGLGVGFKVTLNAF